MNFDSREYKLLIRHELFVAPAAAVRSLWEDIGEALSTLPRVHPSGEFDKKEVRKVCFLDTPDHTLRHAGLVFRQRVNPDGIEYTLKCRSEDRHFAAGTDVHPADTEEKPKLEEDIAPPFLCRFSHSADRVVLGEPESLLEKSPKNLREAAQLFPLLGTLRADGLPCALETALHVVNHIVVAETEWKGAKLHFGENAEESVEKAGVTVIVWKRGKQERPAIAELSFRIKSKTDRFSRELAVAARSVYELLQRQDWALPQGMTKTEYIYRDLSRE